MNWRLGVVGYPIEHSLSPRLHEAGLAYVGLEGSSERVALRDSEVARLGELLAGRFDALSVTMPLKRAAVGVCDELEETAQRLGVVNSLVVRDGRVVGDSTDGAGFVDALTSTFSLGARDVDAVVLGAGGAARAIVDALAGEGARSIWVVGRTPEHVAWLTERYDAVYPVRVADRIDLVVNTVPATGRDDSAPLDGATASTIAVDVAYEPRLTPWREAYTQLGCRSANGLAMLAYQAARQMSWWWGRDVDGATLLGAIA
ncbi:MAG: shikimate dehydrogenase family protein [Acidimicrobiales bacterium]